MTRIGLLSDTHGYLHPDIFEYFGECDEIWHAGDIGNIEIVHRLEQFKPLRAVYGNIDGFKIRSCFSKNLRFICENKSVWITHIGGYPGKYDRLVREEIHKNPPGLFITGHSHILKVMYDKKLDLLYINPGAAGKFGIHKFITAVRFIIDGSDIKDLEPIRLEERGEIV